MTFRGIPQYPQGYGQIPPQSMMNGNQPMKPKRSPIRIPIGNNVGIKQISVPNPYQEINHQQQEIPPPQGQPMQVLQSSQQPVQYFVQQSQQPPQYNRMQTHQPAFSQFPQNGFPYSNAIPIYPPKNGGIQMMSGIQQVPNMQPNSSDSSLMAPRPMQHSLNQPPQIPQQAPPPPQMPQMVPPPMHPQSQMIYTNPYSKVPVDYIQMQQPKMGMRPPPIETKPMIPQNVPPPNMMNYQPQPQPSFQQINQPQQIEQSNVFPVSHFSPDYNNPPIGPFNIIGRGNLPSINFVYTPPNF